MNKRIDSNNISIIVQGPIIKDVTEKCLKQTRKVFKNSQIILSTWIGENTEGLIYDELILSNEPLKARFNKKDDKEVNHTNFQLVSIQNALPKIKGKYCLKLRTDAYVKSSSFLKQWDKYPNFNKNYKFFKHRILIPSVYSREAFDLTGIPMPFHPSDIFMFGLSEDIIDYFAKTNLMTEDELGNWKYLHPEKAPFSQLTYRYCAEQYYCYNWAKRHLTEIVFDDWSDWSNENINISKKVLYNNFAILDYKTHKISTLNVKHKNSNIKEQKIPYLITNKLFEKRYHEFCGFNGDISIVITGIVENTTKQTLRSIKKYIPKSEIILSTWENSDLTDVKGLYDKLVLNKDPKAVIFDDKEKKQNNLNRILVSSQNGIKAATRKYVLRLRSDLILKNNNVLKLADDFKVRNPEKSLFKQRIFAYDIFSIKYNIKKTIRQRMLFHVSDWCYFGLKEDLEEFFNVPLVKEPDFSRYFESHTKPSEDIHQSRLWKMSPEQYFTSSNAAKVFKNLKFENYLDITPENIRISEDFIINNFRVFTQKEWGISTLKNQYKNQKMLVWLPFTYYSNSEQKKDYKRYCDPSAAYKELKLLSKLYNLKYFEQLRKHFLQFAMLPPFYKKPEALFSTIYYLVLFTSSLIKESLCRKK